jgi:hypothetical protein
MLLGGDQTSYETERGGERENIEIIDPLGGLHAPDGAIDDGGKQEQGKPSLRQAQMYPDYWLAWTEAFIAIRAIPTFWLRDDFH